MLGREELIKENDELYCPECGKALKKKKDVIYHYGDVICRHCGVQIKEPVTEENIVLSSGEEETEALKQLTGIKVITILSIVLCSIIWVGGIFASFDEAYYYGAGSGFGLFLFYTVFCGGLIFLSVVGLVGLSRRRGYSIPMGRAVLIIFSFLTGLIPIGIILLVIFWRRFKIPLVQSYLNYKQKK